MEKQNEQLQKIISDVVVSLLQAKDARYEERLVLIQGHLIDAVPGKEPKLENIFHHHHHLERGRAT